MKLLNHLRCFGYVENVADRRTYICKKHWKFVYDKFYPRVAFFIKLFCALGFGMDANFLLARTLVCLFFHSTTILSAVSAWPQQDMKNKMKREDMKRIYRFLHDKHHYFQRPLSVYSPCREFFFSLIRVYTYSFFLSFLANVCIKAYFHPKTLALFKWSVHRNGTAHQGK